MQSDEHEPSDPPTPPPAPHRDRIVATVVDALLIAVVTLPLLVVTRGLGDLARLAVLLVAVALPTFVVEGVFGRSVGKMAVRLSHVPPLAPVPAEVTFLPRWGLKWLVPLVLLGADLPLLAALWWAVDYAPALSGDRRTVHDRVCGTRVLRGA